MRKKVRELHISIKALNGDQIKNKKQKIKEIYQIPNDGI
jgi:hypothetical protein